MTSKAKRNSTKPATGKEIMAITGLEEDEFITAILNIGATPAEVMLAFQWLENEDRKCPESRISMDNKIKNVCEILEARRDLNKIAEHL